MRALSTERSRTSFVSVTSANRSFVTWRRFASSRDVVLSPIPPIASAKTITRPNSDREPLSDP